MVNFSLLVAAIISLVWGTPANFNGFRVLASLLQRRRSMEANHTFHNVWPLPRLIDYIYIGSITARQSSSGHEPNFAVLSTERHLYSAGQPSRWALAHILVVFYMGFVYVFV